MLNDSSLTAPLISPPQPELTLKDFEILQSEISQTQGDLRSHTGKVTCLALSSSNTFLLSGSSDKSINLWSVSDQALLYSFKSFFSEISSISISPDDQYFASSSQDQSFQIYSIQSKLLFLTITNTGKVSSLCFISPSLIASNDEKSVKIWTLAGSLHKQIDLDSPVIYLKFFDSGLFIALSDFSLRYCDVLTESKNEIGKFGEALTALDADANYIACSAGANIKIWTRDFTEKCQLLDSVIVNSLKLADSSKHLLTCSDSFYLTIWNIDIQRKVFGLTYYPNTSICVTATNDFQKIFIGLSDKTVKVFNTVGRRDFFTLFGHTSEVNQLKFTKSGKFLLSASNDGCVKMWEIEKKREVKSFGMKNIDSAALEPSGRLIICGYSDGCIKVWDTRIKKIVKSLDIHQNRVCKIAASDLDLVASASSDFIIKIWNYSTCEVVETLQNHTDEISSLLFINKSLVSISKDKTLQIWDGKSSVFKTFDSTPTALAKSSLRFAVCSDRGLIEVYESSSFSLVYSKVHLYSFSSLKISNSESMVFLLTDKALVFVNYVIDDVSETRLEVPIVSFELSADDKTVIISQEDCRFSLIDTLTKNISVVLSGHSEPAHTLIYSPAASSLFSVSYDRSVRVLMLGNKNQSRLGSTIFGKITALALIDNDQSLLTGNDTGEIRKFSINTEEELLCIPGHKKSIQSIEISSDNTVSATAGDDGFIKIWAIPNLELKFELNSSSAVRCLAFTGEELLISGGSDKQVKVWSSNTRKILYSLTGHSSEINQIKVLGENVYSASSDKTIKKWNLLTKKLELSISSNIFSAQALDVLPSGKLALWNDFNKLIVWNLEEGHKECLLDGHLKFYIKSALFSPNGKFIVSASADSSIKLWNIKNMCETKKITGSDYSVSALKSEDGLIIAGTESGDVIVWKLFEIVFDMREHFGVVQAVDFNKKYEIIASGGSDKSLKIWDFKGNKLRHSIRLEDEVKALAFSKNFEVLVSGCSDKNLYICDFKSGEISGKITGHSNSVQSLVAFGGFFLSGSLDKSIKLWNLNDFTEEFSFKGHTGGVNCLAFSQKKNELASGGKDSNVIIWDLEGRSLKRLFKAHDREISSLCFLKSDSCLLTASEKTIKVWQCETFTLIQSFLGHNDGIFSVVELDSSYFVSSAKDKTLTVWENESFSSVQNLLFPKAKAKIIKPYFSCFYIGMTNGSVYVFDILSGKLDRIFWVFSGCINDLLVDVNQPDILIAAGADREIRVFDMKTKQITAKFCGHTNIVNAVGLSKDSKFIISGSSDSSIKVWNLAEKKEEFTLSGHRRAVLSLQIFNTQIISTSMDKSVKIWDLLERCEISTLKSHKDQVYCSLIIQNETLLATGSKDTSIKIWSFLTARENFSLYGHTDSVIALGESDQRLISGSADCQIKVWNISEKCEEYSFRAHSESLTCLAAWSQIILSGSQDEYLKFWDLKKHYESNRTLKNIISLNERVDWSVSHRFDPYCQDKLVFYNVIDSIRSEDFSQLCLSASRISLGVYKYTIVHILAYLGLDEILSGVLEKCFLLRPDKFNRTALYYAIVKKHQKCADLILEYLCSSIKQPASFESFSSIYSIRSDFPVIISNSSVNLKAFLDILLVSSNVIFFKAEKLPSIFFSEIFIPNQQDFQSTGLEELPVQFDYSLIELPSQIGSNTSIDLLKSILECEDDSIFQTKIIQNYIQYQWNSVKPMIGFYSILLFMNLLNIITLLHDQNLESSVFQISFLSINIILFIWEFVQLIFQKYEYITSLWNLIDFLRFFISIFWIFFFGKNRLFTWVMALINFFRGLTAFRLFDGTRYYVRLILRTINDAKYFMIMLSYSIITFGVLLMITTEDNIQVNFSSIWMIPYKLNFGTYDGTTDSWLLDLIYIIATLINVVVMLNLLVSILGDSHDQFQVEKAIIDYKEKSELCLEINYLVFWKRLSVQRLFLHILKNVSSAGEEDNWEGRMVYLERSIERFGQVFIENQNRFTEKIIESIRLSKTELDEKIEKSGRNEGGDSGTGDIIEQLKLTQTDIDRKIESINRKMNEVNSSIVAKIDGLGKRIENLEKSRKSS